jgi:hypothetical protein
VHVGTIAKRTGIPHDEDPWEWICGVRRIASVVRLLNVILDEFN